MPRPLDIRRLPPLLLNLIGRRLSPFTEVLTRRPANVLFNLASRIRLTPKTHLSTYIFSQFSCSYASLSLDYRLISLGLFFLPFYSKNCL